MGTYRPPWEKIRERYEYFDGEVEIEASYKKAWEAGRFDIKLAGFGKPVDRSAAARKAAATRARRKAERDAANGGVDPTEGIKVGDFFSSSWGYDQTQVDFYEVVGVTKASVKVRKVGSRNVAGPDNIHEARVPVLGAYLDSKPRIKRVERDPNGSVWFTVASYAVASKWDGKPEYQTGAYYGR